MPSPTRTPDPPDPAAGRDTPAAGRDPDTPAASSGPRLITVPAGWPPYDCDVHGAACPAAHEAAAVTPPAGTRAPPPAPVPRPAPVPEPGPHEVPATPAAALPVQFAQVIVEILAGFRPPRQIAPWATERVRAQVDGLTRLFAADQRHAAERRPRIRRVVTSWPSASVVEMTVVVSFGPRSRALAMRFEHVPARRPTPGLPTRPARWLCTEMEAC